MIPPVTADAIYVTKDGTSTFLFMALLQEIIAAIAAVETVSGTAAWGDVTGTLADQTDLDTALDGKAAVAHTHDAADVTDLATVTLDAFANPVAALDFAQQETRQFVIENRTSDPGSPATGEIWIRTDLP